MTVQSSRYTASGDLSVYAGEALAIELVILRDGVPIDPIGREGALTLWRTTNRVPILDPIAGETIDGTDATHGAVKLLRYVLPGSATDLVFTKHRTDCSYQIASANADGLDYQLIGKVVPKASASLGAVPGSGEPPVVTLSLETRTQRIVVDARGAPGLAIWEALGLTAEQYRAEQAQAGADAGEAAGATAGGVAGAAAGQTAGAAAGATAGDASGKAAGAAAGAAAVQPSIDAADAAAANADTKGSFADTQGRYAKAQGDAIGDISAAVTATAANRKDAQTAATSANTAKTFIQSVARQVYPTVKADVEVALDAAGVPRIVAMTRGTESLRYQSDPTYQPPGIAAVASYLGRSYPDYVRVAPDTAGKPRIVEAVGREVTGATLFGGVGVGSIAAAPPPVYMMFAVLGQSNPDGRGAGGVAPAAGIAFMYKGGQIVPLTDPVGIESLSAGSAWPAFAQELFDRYGIRSIIVPCARGGTTLLDSADAGFGTWGPGGGSQTGPTLRERAVANIAAARAAATAAGMAHQLAGVLWSLGETEAGRVTAGTTSAADFAAAFAPLRDYVRAQTGAGAKLPWIIGRTGFPYNADTSGAQAVRAAQEQWCRDDDNVWMGWTGAVTLPARGLMLTSTAGELHYNQQGYDEMGRAMARVAAMRCAGVC